MPVQTFIYNDSNISIIGAPDVPVSGEEFNGPYTTWLNVRDFGATGDGVTNDTPFIQAGIDALIASTTQFVLYFPAGTYKISRLTILSGRNIALIGEDPETTTFTWAGGADHMFFIGNTEYSKFSRFTLNGAGGAVDGFYQFWEGSPIQFFDTGNEYSDCIIRNTTYGIRGGDAGHGFAETSILRCQFYDISSDAILLRNFNALDCWVWYCIFERCNRGVSNVGGAGGFNVNHCIFRNSTIADIALDNCSFFNWTHNYSINSRKFVETGFNPSWTLMVIQGNTIIDPVEDCAIDINQCAGLLLADNTIRSRAGAATPIVKVSTDPGGIVAVHNTFTVASPIFVHIPNGKLREVSTSIVSTGSISATEPTLPGFQPKVARNVTYIEAGASTATIQAAIDAAAAQNGTRPIIHLPPTGINITTTLTVPANADLQIVSDTYNCVVGWTGVGAGPMFRLQGPTRCLLRDFEINGAAGVADGIIVEGATSGRIFGRQVMLLDAYMNNLFADDLLSTLTIEMHDFQHRQQFSSVGAESFVSTGAAPIRVYSGASSHGQNNVYNISGASDVVLMAVWFEGVVDPPLDSFIHVTGNGRFTFAGARVASGPMDSSTLGNYVFENFTGIAMLGELDGRGQNVGDDGADVVIIGDATGGQVLAQGLFSSEVDYLNDTSSPAGTSLFINNFQVGGPPVALADEGVYSDSVVSNCTSQLIDSTPITLISSIATGNTDLQLFHLRTSSCRRSLHIKRGV